MTEKLAVMVAWLPTAEARRDNTMKIWRIGPGIRNIICDKPTIDTKSKHQRRCKRQDLLQQAFEKSSSYKTL